MENSKLMTPLFYDGMFNRDPSQTTLEPWERFCFGMLGLERRMG